MAKMNIRSALKAAQKRWGKRAMVQDAKHPSDAETQAKASAELKRLRDTLTETERYERRKEIMALRDVALYYRYSVGYVAMGAFFSVEGQGHTWEEAFAKADEREARFRKVA